MKQGRLPWLLAIMCVLVAVRWLVPNALAPDPTSKAVVRATHSASAVSSNAQKIDPPLPAVIPIAPLVLDVADNDVAGNAFAVRQPPVPVPPPAPPAPPVVARAAPPAPPVPDVPPPPPPPAINVFGTWDDGTAPGVFVSTPNGTLLARKGNVLLSEYRVTAVTRDMLTVEHVTSKQEYRFNVPRAAGK